MPMHFGISPNTYIIFCVIILKANSNVMCTQAWWSGYIAVIVLRLCLCWSNFKRCITCVRKAHVNKKTYSFFLLGTPFFSGILTKECESPAPAHTFNTSEMSMHKQQCYRSHFLSKDHFLPFSFQNSYAKKLPKSHKSILCSVVIKQKDGLYRYKW